ncbi:MAG: hypothetical protein DRG78_10025 [Epsilonproteobacteria bacterium]|nr:MAG: hypothetical protein DRG78_10025 [Campylobacterota bacterium]
MLTEKFGSKFVYYISDTYQNLIVVNGIKINKPKGWLPAIIKDNGKSYILNIINEKFIFINISDYYFKNNKNGILLTNGLNKVIIVKSLNDIDLDRTYMTKYYSNNKELYIIKNSNFTIIIYPKRKLIISMDFYIPEVIEEIIK